MKNALELLYAQLSLATIAGNLEAVEVYSRAIQRISAQ